MTNNASLGMEGLDAAEIRQDSNKVSEEAIKRIQEQGKKAKKAQQDIKDDKSKNEQLAKFLTFLFRTIENQNIIQLMYNVFFKVKNPKTKIVYMRKDINTRVLVGVFVPLYRNQAQEYAILQSYESIITQQTTTSIVGFIDYLKKLATLYHDNIPLDREALTAFLTELIGQYMPVHKDKNTQERKTLIQAEIVQSLYGK